MDASTSPKRSRFPKMWRRSVITPTCRWHGKATEARKGGWLGKRSRKIRRMDNGGVGDSKKEPRKQDIDSTKRGRRRPFSVATPQNFSVLKNLFPTRNINLICDLQLYSHHERSNE